MHFNKVTVYSKVRFQFATFADGKPTAWQGTERTSQGKNVPSNFIALFRYFFS